MRGAMVAIIIAGTTVGAAIVPSAAAPPLRSSAEGMTVSSVSVSDDLRSDSVISPGAPGAARSEPAVDAAVAAAVEPEPLPSDAPVPPSTEPAASGGAEAATASTPVVGDAVRCPLVTSSAAPDAPTVVVMPGFCSAGPAPVVTPPPSGSAPLTGRLYVDPTSRAAVEAARLQSAGRTADAAMIRVIAEQPQAVWINGDQTGSALVASLTAHRTRAAAAGQRLVFVTYAISFRDCGSYSAGGLAPDQYQDWNRTIASTLRGSGAIVIVEPDALAGVTSPACASVAQSRPAVIKQAVETLAAAGLTVYIDAGHSNWVGDAAMASLLTQAGVASARGFSTNVSNYRTTESEVGWAQRVSDRLGGKRFVVDVSRNGNGPNGEWCNPLGRALGVNPTLDVRDGALDGLLWVKRPGESDGTCNGGPTAGQWWHDYAIGLVQQR